jgi:hypothetical protein
LRPLPALIFAAPVAAWIYLYYREGGTAYLREHFVPNIFGRLLGIHLSRFDNTDLGRTGPWYFYLDSLPVILGPWLLVLPFALWESFRTVRRSSGEPPERQAQLFFLVFGLLPSFLLSFSFAKETSYILPSYGALAAMVAGWLDRRLPEEADHAWRGAGWLWPVLPLGAVSLVWPYLGLKPYLMASAALAVPALLALIHALWSRERVVIAFLVLSLSLHGAMVAHSPQLLAQWRFKKRCYLPLAEAVWSRVGEGPLFLYDPKDTLRGSISFYGQRTVLEIDRRSKLRSVLLERGRAFVLTNERDWQELARDSNFQGLIHEVPLPDLGLKHHCVLLSRSYPEG